MTNQLLVSTGEVDFYTESLSIPNLLELDNRNYVGTKYRIENKASISFENTHFDEVSNTVCSLGTYFLLFYLMNYKFNIGKPVISDCYFEDKKNATRKFSTEFSKSNYSRNRMVFHNGDFETLKIKLTGARIKLNGILELNYYLCKQFSGRKSSHLSRLNSLQSRSVDAFKAIIEEFKDDSEFSFDNSPRYFLNYFMKSKNIINVKDMTNKQLKEAMCFLRNVFKITLRYLGPDERVDVTKNIEKNRYACIYRSLSIKLTQDEENKEDEKETKNDGLPFTFRIYDANTKEIICKNLLFFSFKNTLIIPYDEMLNRKIHYIEIYYKKKYFKIVDVSEFLDKAKTTPEFFSK